MIQFPKIVATVNAPVAVDISGECHISSDSSPPGGLSVQISQASELICTSDIPIKLPSALFTQCSSFVSPITAGSGIVPAKGTPICGPLYLGNHMPQTIASLDSDRSGNFRSVISSSPLLGAPVVSVNSSGFRPPISNSFLPVAPHITSNVLDQTISKNAVYFGNAQIVGCRPSSPPSSSVLDVKMAESTVVATGSGLHSPSPAAGSGQLFGQRVDSAGSTGQHGKVNSAAHAVRSVLPGASGAAPLRSVPPTVSFRDILGRTDSSRPSQAFSDVDLLPEMPASTVRDGIPGILFPDQVITALSVPFRFTLVGRISGNRGVTPNSDILSALSCIGLLGSHTVRFLPRGYLVLTLFCEEDYLRFWSQPVVSIRSVVIRFSKWTPEFKYEEDSSIVPVWVRFPDLPLHLYAKQSLFPIAKILGNHVHIDEITATGSRGSYARVCIEIDVLQPRPTQIWVGWGDHCQVIDVVYESVPHFCSHCRLLGHSSERCVSAGYPSAAARAKAQGKRPQASPSVALDPLGSSQDVPSGSASVPLEPGWHRQRRCRRQQRRPAAASSTPSGNPFEVLQVQDDPVQGDSSGCGLSRDLDTIVEDISYESEFPAMGVPPVLSDVVSGPVVMRIDTPVFSTIVSGAPQGSFVEVSPIPVVVTPAVPPVVSAVVASTPQVAVVAPMVVSDPVVTAPVVAPRVPPVFPKFDSIPNIDKRVKTSAGADAATSYSLPLPVRTHDRPIDPG